MEIQERLKFYGDTQFVKNKYFCFKINSIFDLEASLKRFMKLYYIRSAWYECIEDGTVKENSRIDLTNFVDYNLLNFSNVDLSLHPPLIS